MAIEPVQSNSIGGLRPSAETSTWAAAFLLMTALLGLRLSASGHPWPVHPDESEFVAAIGFPRPYPVHPPGYPLWVAAGTLLTKTGLSPYVAYQSMSVAASCIGPAVLYLALRGLVGGAIAWWAAFALGVNPAWWFEGVTALNYSAANCVALGAVALLWRVRNTRSCRDLFLAILTLTVAGSLRPDVWLWLGPVAVATSFRIRPAVAVYSLIAIICGLVAGVVGTARVRTGAAPAIEHTLHVIWSTSVFSRGIVDGVCRNAVKLGVYLAWGLGIGILALSWSIVRLIRIRDRPIAMTRSGDAKFLILWIAPVFLFQILIHVTELGHSLWYLPAIYTVMAAGLATLRSRRLAVAVLVCVSAGSIAQFYLYPWRAEVTGWRRVLNAKVAFGSAQGLARIDQRALIHRPNDYWAVPGGDVPR